MLAQKGSQNDPKMAPKIDRKINDFFIAKSNELLGKMDPKWSPKWLQIRTKSSIFRGHLGLRRHLASKGAKWSQNASPKGCQMELKSSKMDPEWAPEGFKMDPNWMSNHAGTKVFGSKLKPNKKTPPSSSIMQRFGKDGGFSPHRSV